MEVSAKKELPPLVLLTLDTTFSAEGDDKYRMPVRAYLRFEILMKHVKYTSIDPKLVSQEVQTLTVLSLTHLESNWMLSQESASLCS